MAAKSLSDKAIILIVGGGVNSLLQTVTSLVLVRLFDSQGSFGSYRQVWLVLNTLTPIFLLGLTQSIYYFLPTLAHDHMRAFMTRMLLLLAGSGLIASIGLFALAGPVARLLSNPGLEPLLRAASFYFFFTVPAMVLFHFLVTRGLHARATLINLGFYFAQTVLILISVAVGMRLEQLFMAVVGLAALRFLWTLVEIRKHTQGHIHAELPVRLSGNLSYAIPVWFSMMANTLGRHLDKLIISNMLGVTKYAVYAVGAVEFPGIMLVSSAANTVLRPHLAKLHHEGRTSEIWDIWRNAFRRQALAILPMGVFLAVFAHEFIELLYTREYGAAVLPFQIYLMLALFRIAPQEVLLTSVGRTRTVLLGTLAFLGVNLGLSLFLIGPLKMAGPPLATVVASGALTAYYARQAAVALGVTFRNLLPVGIVLRVGLVAVAAVLLALPVRMAELGRLATLAAGGTVFTLGYLAIGRWSRTLTPADLAVVRGWFSLHRRLRQRN